MDRRDFFRTASIAGTVCVAGRPVSANEAKQKLADANGVLVDVTKCIGCRKCEWACNESNHLPTQALESWETQDVFSMIRRPDRDHYTIVNQYDPPEAAKPLNVKFQCMHCDDPACASACLVSALEKRENGAVEYDASRCMGCRYCMVACPFQIPAYEYDEPLAPKVQKCTFCIERISDGGVPACVEVCPPQCLTFGKRDELVTLAHQIVDTHPDGYIDHIYGEHEVGGTSWMYIASQPFEEIGLPTLGEEAPPQITEPLQHGIFKHFIPQATTFGVLGMAAAFTKRTNEIHEVEHSHAAPVKRKFFTPGVIALMLVAGAGFIAALWRFIFGIGSVTNLNDQFPWGIWIAIDVATGVALAAGGFTTAAVAHIFHREKYHDLVRPALLTAVLGYTFVVIGLTADLGRYYNVWHPM
ncbi:4Fe-4S dicluster domain-containing protein, partial [bacterium]|nr:4Fe-4S dicluster domain-containing protein [bacterium]